MQVVRRDRRLLVAEGVGQSAEAVLFAPGGVPAGMACLLVEVLVVAACVL